MILYEWLAFYSAFSEYPLVPHETAAVLAQVLCTSYNRALCHFMQSHIRKVYACLAVTCHLHFWQNDLDLLRATVVTRGWNRYQNKSQHRKLTLEKKILPPLLQGFEPATFQSWVWRSNHCAIPALIAVLSLCDATPGWAEVITAGCQIWDRLFVVVAMLSHVELCTLMI